MPGTTDTTSEARDAYSQIGLAMGDLAALQNRCRVIAQEQRNEGYTKVGAKYDALMDAATSWDDAATLLEQAVSRLGEASAAIPAR